VKPSRERSSASIRRSAGRSASDGDLRTYDVRYTIAHEIGHTIGLDHPSGASQIMGYRYEETVSASCSRGDIAGAVLLYASGSRTDIIAASEARTSQTRHRSRRRLYAKAGEPGLHRTVLTMSTSAQLERGEGRSSAANDEMIRKRTHGRFCPALLLEMVVQAAPRKTRLPVSL